MKLTKLICFAIFPTLLLFVLPTNADAKKGDCLHAVTGPGGYIDRLEYYAPSRLKILDIKGEKENSKLKLNSSSGYSITVNNRCATDFYDTQPDGAFDFIKVEYIANTSVLGSLTLTEDKIYKDFERMPDYTTVIQIPPFLPGYTSPADGVRDVFDNAFYEKVVNAMAQKATFKVRLTDGLGNKEEVVIAQADGTCITSGEEKGKIGVVILRGKSAAVPLSWFMAYIPQWLQGFRSTDPLKSNIKEFSFYIDLKNYDDSSWISDVNSGDPKRMTNAMNQIKANSECKGKSIYGLAGKVPEVHRWTVSGIGNGVFVFNTRANQNDILHAVGHAFASLGDEFMYSKNVKSIFPVPPGNCTVEPETSYLFAGERYGRSEAGCNIVTSDPRMTEYTYQKSYASSFKNIMTADVQDNSGLYFNAISCAIISQKIAHDNDYRTYLPLCGKKYKVTGILDPAFPFDATPPSIAKDLIPDAIPTVSWGDYISIPVEGKMVEGDTYALLTETSTGIKRRLEVGHRILLKVLPKRTEFGIRVPIKFPLGTHQVRVSTDVSSWSEPVTIRIIQRSTPIFVPSSLEYGQVYKEYCEVKECASDSSNDFSYSLNWNDRSGGVITQKSLEYSDTVKARENCILTVNLDRDFTLQDVAWNVCGGRKEKVETGIELINFMLGVGRSQNTTILPAVNVTAERTVSAQSKIKMFMEMDPKETYRVTVHVKVTELRNYPGQKTTIANIEPKDFTVGGRVPDSKGNVIITGRGGSVHDVTIKAKNAKLFVYDFSIELVEFLNGEIAKPIPEPSSSPDEGNLGDRLKNFTDAGAFTLTNRLMSAPLLEFKKAPAKQTKSADAVEYNEAYITRANAISNLYSSLLKRRPSPAELEVYAKSTLTVSQISEKIKATNEYRNLPKPLPSPSITPRPSISTAPFFRSFTSPTTTVTPTATPSPYYSVTPTPLPVSQSPSSTPVPSVSPSMSPSPSPFVLTTPSPTPTPTLSPSSSPSSAPSPSNSPFSAPSSSSSSSVSSSPSPVSRGGAYSMASVIYSFADWIDSFFGF